MTRMVKCDRTKGYNTFFVQEITVGIHFFNQKYKIKAKIESQTNVFGANKTN